MASINGLDADLFDVAILNANENIFIRGQPAQQGQVISYNGDRKIEFSDVVNDNDNIAVIAPIFKTVAVGPPPVHTLSLGYNTNDFQLDGSNRLELKDTYIDTAVLPLSITSDTITLDINNTLEVVGGELGVVSSGGGGEPIDLYKDSATNLYYRLLTPSDFMNGIKIVGGHSACVINNTANGAEGALQCWDGLSYYTYFNIPNGYTFTGFRVNMTNSAGTPTTPASSATFYCKVKSKSIGAAAIDVGANQAYNTDNVGYTSVSGWDTTWVIGDSQNLPKMMMIECYRSPDWTNAYYNGGGWIQFTQTVAAPITSFTLANDYIDGFSTPILMYINYKPTAGKSYNDAGSNVFSPSDFVYQLNVAYPITTSVSGGSWGFSSLVNCSVSSGSWDGDNSDPVFITFTSAISSAEFYAEN